MKYKVLFFSIIYLLVVSLIAQSIGLQTDSVIIDVSGPVESKWWQPEWLATVISVAESFWKLITFQIKGISNWIVIFFVYPDIILLIVIIVSLIRGTN